MSDKDTNVVYTGLYDINGTAYHNLLEVIETDQGLRLSGKRFTLDKSPIKRPIVGMMYAVRVVGAEGLQRIVDSEPFGMYEDAGAVAEWKIVSEASRRPLLELESGPLRHFVREQTTPMRRMLDKANKTHRLVLLSMIFEELGLIK